MDKHSSLLWCQNSNDEKSLMALTPCDGSVDFPEKKKKRKKSHLVWLCDFAPQSTFPKCFFLNVPELLHP
jgi:hypothetical protein